MELLKLIAMDRDDLEVVSAHLQDSNVKAGEILWRPGDKRVVIALDRFDWEAANGDHPHWQRRRTALRKEGFFNSSSERALIKVGKSFGSFTKNGSSPQRISRKRLAPVSSRRTTAMGSVGLMLLRGGKFGLSVYPK